MPKSKPFKLMSFEEKRKAFSWYIDAIKDMKYGTYKNIAERFGVSDRHLRRLRSGDRNVTFKLFDRVRKSFRILSRKYYFLVVTVEGQSEMVAGTTIRVLTYSSAMNAIARVERSQKTDRMYYSNIWRQGTKDRFRLSDFKEIGNLIRRIEDIDELIFINSYDLITDLIDELEGKEKEEASMLAYDYI